MLKFYYCFLLIICLLSREIVSQDEGFELFSYEYYDGNNGNTEHKVLKDSDEPRFSNDKWACGDCNKDMELLYEEYYQIHFNEMEVQISLWVPGASCTLVSGVSKEDVIVQRAGGACSGGSTELRVRRATKDNVDLVVQLYGH